MIRTVMDTRYVWLGLAFGTMGLALIAVTVGFLLTIRSVKSSEVVYSSLANFSTEPTIVITEANNKFSYFVKNTAMKTITVTPNSYTATDLATELQDQFNKNAGNWIVTYDITTARFEITAEAFEWERCQVQNSIYDDIGFSNLEKSSCGSFFSHTEVSKPILSE